MSEIFKENETTELKKSTSELKEALVSIVAILNKHKKGTLYFGIKDDGTVIGQNVSAKTLRDVSEAISSKIEPRIYPTITNVKIEGKDCILIDFEGNNIPYVADGRAYIRVSDQDRQLSINEMRKLLEKNEDKKYKWEEQPSDITFEDIDEETLKKFIEKGKEKGRISYEYTNKEEVLKRLNLITKNGKIKNAGYVLFAKNPDIRLRVAIFATEEKITFLDMQDFSGNVFKLIDDGEQYISKNIRWSANFNTGSFAREDIPEVPIRAMREIICNSFLHRAWNSPYENTIAIYKNRIEVSNPGIFTDEATPEDYIKGVEPSRPRNPLIAQTVYFSGEIEKWGTGLKNVYEKCTEENLKVEFEDRHDTFFVVVYRKQLEELVENTEKILDKPENSELNSGLNSGLNIHKEHPELKEIYVDILELMLSNKYITQAEIAKTLKKSSNTIYRNIKTLRELQIVERIGSKKDGYWQINL